MALQHRSGADRLSVFLDGEYAFSLAAVVGAHLREATTLSRAEIQELLDGDAAERAYERSLSFLAARPRSRTEVRRRLHDADLPPAAIDAALARLEGNGLVSDEEFAAYWVTQRLAFHPRGPRALRAELRAKGVDADTVAAAIEPTLDGQVEAACRAVGKRAMRLPAATGERDFTRTIITLLVRRGFDYDVAREAARHLWQQRRVDADDEE